jgi:hypothetical protein
MWNFIAHLDNVTADAVAMYQRLRKLGQTGTLARISVEARYSTLTNIQRQQLRQAISRVEAER